MSIAAAIDIGTNSTRLLVAETVKGQWKTLYRDLQVTRLGAGLGRSGQLRPEAVQRTVAVVEAFAEKARALGAQKINIAATYAARQASNGSLLERSLAERGLWGRIISGEEEADLAFRGVVAGLPQLRAYPLLVVDVGGGSTELISGKERQAQGMLSLPLGAVELNEALELGEAAVEAGTQKLMRDRAERTLRESVPADWSFSDDLQLVAVGGTATSLVAVHLGLAEYDPNRVHGQKLSRRELEQMRAELAALPLAGRREVRGLQPERADIIVPGAIILETVVDWFAGTELTVSEGDLLLGLLEVNGLTGTG